MSTNPSRLRLSPALRALLEHVSPNLSAAQRALLLLGAGVAGYDLSACKADLGRLLGENLDPRVREAINALYLGRRSDAAVAAETDGLQATYRRSTHDLPADYSQPTSELQPAYSRPTPASAPSEQPEPDPFTSVGIDV